MGIQPHHVFLAQSGLRMQSQGLYTTLAFLVGAAMCSKHSTSVPTAATGTEIEPSTDGKGRTRSGSQLLEPGDWVRIRRKQSSPHHVGAQIISIQKTTAMVRTIAHRRLEKVNLSDCRLWVSKNAAYPQRTEIRK